MPPLTRSKATPILQTSASARRVHRDAQNDVHPNGPIAGCRDSSAHCAAHPIHSLPLEILSQIFILTLHIDFAAVSELHETSRHSERHLQIFNPLVLCAVCSSWRSLAFATPRLWQRVSMHFPFRFEKVQAQKRAAILIQWIERARSLPLAMHMSCDHLLDGLARKAPLLAVIYATRWESLYFRDRLTTLQLGPSPTLALTLFQNCKWHMLLQATGRFDPYHSYIHDDFPWAELTRLQLDNHHRRMRLSCEDILTKTPKLVQLSISVPCLRAFSGSIILQNLVTFSLYMSRGSDHLLNHLYLPSLRDMFIKQISSEHIEPLLNFFTRSSCSLSKLEVYGQNLPPDGLVNVLAHRSCNSLTSLKILELCDLVGPQQKRELVNDDVLRRLTLHQDDSLCPHLKFLTIDCATECSLSALLKLVESRVGRLTDRQPLNEPIQYLHLRSIKHVNDVRKLDEFGKGSGMEYTSRKYREVSGRCSRYFYSGLLQKQGLQRERLLGNHGGFFIDLDLPV